MNRPFRIVILPALVALPFLFVACTSNEKVQVGGVPEWLAGGAKLSAEPAPRKPDAAMPHYPSESGPVEMTIITDKRQYPAPPARKKTSGSDVDPLERGREARIRRLVR